MLPYLSYRTFLQFRSADFAPIRTLDSSMLRLLTLCLTTTCASAAFPGKYTLDAAWPADLAKIGVRFP